MATPARDGCSRGSGSGMAGVERTVKAGDLLPLRQDAKGTLCGVASHNRARRGPFASSSASTVASSTKCWAPRGTATPTGDRAAQLQCGLQRSPSRVLEDLSPEMVLCRLRKANSALTYLTYRPPSPSLTKRSLRIVLGAKQVRHPNALRGAEASLCPVPGHELHRRGGF